MVRDYRTITVVACVCSFGVPLGLLRGRESKCNFCIQTPLAKFIFHVDCDDLCVKITAVGYVGKEASRNSDGISLASAKTGQSDPVETTVGSLGRR